MWKGLMLLVAVMAAMPVASALEEVAIEVPELTAHIDGVTVDVPTTDAAPVQVIGSVEVRDVDLSLSETRCTLATDRKIKDFNAEDRASCTPGTVSATQNIPLEAELDIILPQASEAEPAAAPATIGTAAAIGEVVLANETILRAAAAAGASMLGLYAAWRILKWTGLAAILPLYSHISDDEILDDPNRAGIYRLIQTEPGISTKDIADRLDLAWGTVTHHLGKLEKRRFIVSKKYGKYRRYFANGAGGSQDKDTVAVLRLDRTGDVAALIREQPGMTQKAVSQVLGVSSSTILWHVKRLEQVHLVRKVREGKLVRYYPGEGMQGVDLIPAAAPLTAA